MAVRAVRTVVAVAAPSAALIRRVMFGPIDEVASRKKVSSVFDNHKPTRAKPE